LLRLVGLGIVNVMILVVEGMKREIGVLKAIGLSSRKISILFIIVSLFYSLIGYLLGVSIASVLVYMAGSICIEVGGQHYSIIPVYTPVGYLYSFLYTIILTIISCSLSAYRASRYEPVEVMRFG